MHRLSRVAYWAALMAPAAAVLFLILRYGVNVPFSDQWDFVHHVVGSANGQLSLAALFNQHNEHRMVFPMLAMLALARLTQWNTVVEMAASVGIAALTLMMLERLVRPVLAGAGWALRIWAMLTISLLLFSFTQSENWLWGWQIQWFLAVLAAVSAVAFATWSLESPAPWRNIAAAATACIVCQLSIASGIATWGAAGLVLVFHRNRWRILPVWIVVAAIVTGLYLVGYQKPPHHPSPLDAFKVPAEFLAYLGNYMSGPLGRSAKIGAAIIGAFLVLGAVALVRNRQRPELVAPWIAIGAFAGANAFITAIGSVGFGPAQALESRYVTIALLMSVALVPLWLLAFRDWPRLRPAAAVMGIVGGMLFTYATIAGDRRGLADFARLHQKMATGRQCALSAEVSTDACLALLYPRPETVRDRMPVLRAFGWSGLPANDPALAEIAIGTSLARWQIRMDAGADGWIDVAEAPDGVLHAAGWAHHPKGNDDVIRRVVVAAGDTIVGDATIGLERPDVAAHYGPGFLRSGWVLRAAGAPAAGSRMRAYLVLGDGVLAPLAGEVVLGVPKG